jgi:hypothetical protein
MEGIKMPISLISIALLIALSGSAHSLLSTSLSLITSVEPDSGKVGDMLTARGTNLGQGTVAALYLTDGTNDIKMVITEQSADSIKFRIPPEAKPGRFALMILTMDKELRLLEQPVKVVVEIDTAAFKSPRQISNSNRSDRQKSRYG